MSQQTSKGARQVHATYRGGPLAPLAALAPLVLFLTGATYLGLSGAPDERGLWPVLLAALLLGTLLARSADAYAEAAVRSAARPVVLLMLLAWMLAGALSAVLRASGLVPALVELARIAGADGGLWVAAAFLIAAAVSTATGTSLGTLILCVPLIHPAGDLLGSDPTFLLAALLGGATFGDNLSPVSDTTIASATTQGAPLRQVVRSRLRYALPAGLSALVLYALLGGTSSSATPHSAADLVPASLSALWMLSGPALVLVFLLRGRHLVVGLLWGVATSVLVGLATGALEPAQLLQLDREQFVAVSLLLDGVGNSAGLCLVTVLLMALVGGFEQSGLLDDFVAAAVDRTRSARSAEAAQFAMTSAAVLLTTHSGVAILSVGDAVRRLGTRFGISPTRRANLMDLTVCTYPFLLPWFIPTLLAAGLARGSQESGTATMVSALEVGMHNIYSWLLAAITLTALVTGWGRGDHQPSGAESDGQVVSRGG